MTDQVTITLDRIALADFMQAAHIGGSLKKRDYPASWNRNVRATAMAITRQVAPEDGAYYRAQPMLRKHLVKLKAGDVFWVFWIKDGHTHPDRADHSLARINGVVTVERHDPAGYLMASGDVYPLPDDVRTNEADCTRGTMYYFHAVKVTP